MNNKQAELVKQMTDKELIKHLYFSQFLFLMIGIVLAIFLFDGWSDFLSIWIINIYDIFIIGSVVGISVVFIDLLLMMYVPKRLFDDGGINEKMFQRRSVAHIILLTFLIAVAEEFLFRGVIQTHFGLLFASILFALLHVRYLKVWLLLVSVVVLSFLLGYVYELTGSLYVTIWAHFIIDLLLALKIRRDYIKNKSNNNGGDSNG